MTPPVILCAYFYSCEVAQAKIFISSNVVLCEAYAIFTNGQQLDSSLIIDDLVTLEDVVYRRFKQINAEAVQVPIDCVLPERVFSAVVSHIDTSHFELKLAGKVVGATDPVGRNCVSLNSIVRAPVYYQTGAAIADQDIPHNGGA